MKCSLLLTKGGLVADNVNHPAHYKAGGIETIDYLKAKLGKEGFEAFCVGNCIKYLSRYKHKNGLEDLKKSRWYVNALIESTENKSEV